MGVLIALESTIRDWINILFDANTFNELGKQVKPLLISQEREIEELNEGVITGYGTINGQLVFIYCQDGASPLGSFSQRQGEKICQLLQLACTSKAPAIGLIDSKGARIAEGLDILKSYSKVYQAHLRAGKQIPLIIGVMGKAVGADALIPNMADLVFALRSKTNWYLNTLSSLQNAGEQATEQAHFLFETEEQLLAGIATLLKMLPGKGAKQQLNLEQVTSQLELAAVNGAELENRIAEGLAGDYDVIDYLNLILGSGNFLELQGAYGHGMVTGLANIMGITVGILANQPKVNQGRVDVFGLRKASKLVDLCQQYRMPLLSFVDCKGILAQSGQEHLGITQETSNFYKLYTLAYVPKISFILGTAVGSCFNLFASKAGADLVYAWPTAEIGLLNAEATNYITNYYQVQQADNPGSKWQETLEQTKDQVGTPKAALATGLIDGQIQPGDTYLAIYNSLNMLLAKSEAQPSGLEG